MDFTKALNRLGESAIMREDEPDDIGAAFQKFAVVTKELALLMKDLLVVQLCMIEDSPTWGPFYKTFTAV